jgi:hypothetical protein
MSPVLLGLLSTLLGFVLDHALETVLGLGFVFVAKRVSTKERAALFENLCRVAYGMVANFVALTSTKLDDKAAKGLEVLADLFKQHGLTLTDTEKAAALARFDALHGEERAKASAAAKALAGNLAQEKAALDAARRGNVVPSTAAAPVLFGE